MRVIKDNRIQEDNWILVNSVDADQPLPEGDLVLPLSFWKENREKCEQRNGKTAVFLNGDNNLSEIEQDLDKFELIALEFPAFKDGRCYSHARLLRDRYGYKGDIRAVGDVLRDQLFFMNRCGISSFALREDKDMEDALNALKDFTVTYQSASDDRPPIYKIR